MQHFVYSMRTAHRDVCLFAGLTKFRVVIRHSLIVQSMNAHKKLNAIDFALNHTQTYSLRNKLAAQCFVSRFSGIPCNENIE